MSTPVPYSAVIRAIARTPDLDRLLESLSRQTAPPAEILIAIPDDVEPWSVETSPAQFVRSKRGMVSQRAAGVLNARNPYLLLLDDDVVLGETAAATLVGALACGQAQCVVPYTISGWPTGLKRWICAMSGIAVPRKAGGVEYTAGGGYYYPSRPPPPEGWETAGGLGQVVALDRRFALEHQALGDRELEASSRYPIREDGTFILLLSKAGGRCLMIPGVEFVHAGDGRAMPPATVRERYRAQIENHYLFWSKHVRPAYSDSLRRRALARLLVSCHVAGNCVIAAASSMRARSLAPLSGALEGAASLVAGRGTRSRA